MSEYYKSLDPLDQNRYLDKLKLLDLAENDDPYAPDMAIYFATILSALVFTQDISWCSGKFRGT